MKFCLSLRRASAENNKAHLVSGSRQHHIPAIFGYSHAPAQPVSDPLDTIFGSLQNEFAVNAFYAFDYGVRSFFTDIRFADTFFFKVYF
jgi:hypothetical protein